MPCKPLYCMCGSVVLPQRYVLCFMIFLSVAVSYALRNCINIAIVKMVIAPNITTNGTHQKHDACPMLIRDQVEVKGGSYNWTDEQRGRILGAFFPGYAIGHVPGGFMADVFGGKHVLATGVVLSGALTLLTPMAIVIGDWYLLLITRVIIGLAQGPVYPCMSTLLAKWVPLRERTTLGAIVNSGNQIGSVAGYLVTSYLMQFINWEFVFYFWGVVALVWYILFIVTCYSEPSKHPFITPEEAQMLDQEIGSSKKLKIPWMKIFKDPVIWALIAGQVGHDYIFFLVVVQLPWYMDQVLKLKITDNGILNSITYLSLWICSVITGLLADYLIAKDVASILFLRKLYTFIGNIGPSVFVIVAAYIGCDRLLASIMFIVAMFVMGPFYAGMKINVLDVTRNFAGIIMAIVNGLGALAFFPIPRLVAVMTPDGSLTQWRQVFWLIGVVNVVLTLLYMVFTSAERAEWDKPEGEA